MLARMLQQAGYATGHFGKWHLGGQRDVGDAPLITAYGFDESVTNFEGLGPRVLPLLDAYDGQPAKRHSLGSDSLGHGPIRWQPRDKVTSSYVLAAMKFIDAAKQNQQPFYINVWPDDVHTPLFPPKDRRGDGSKRALYLGVLGNMDEQLGPLFDHIRNDETLRNDTLVILCSDNGPEAGAGSAANFRGGKGMLYEGGVRSPLIVWGPGFVVADKVGTANTSSYFSAIDLVPTLCAIANLEPPGVRFDGEPLPQVLLGNSDGSRQGPLVFRRPPDWPNHPTQGELPDLAVRHGKWKLLCEYDGSNPQLYDLETDPGERTNLASDQPEVVERLTAAAVDWNRSMPADNGPNY
jgi:uncharacterized sulfatase